MMPLVNCILCFVDHALLLSLCYLLLKFVVYLSSMPRWVEPMPSLICVNQKSFHKLYYSGVLPDIISTLQLYRKREVNGRLCIEEVGVNLELCVHAHGPDVEFIMEAICDNNNLLVISSSGIYVWSFATVVLTMIVLL